jgi:hypothetical protein
MQAAYSMEFMKRNGMWELKVSLCPHYPKEQKTKDGTNKKKEHYNMITESKIRAFRANPGILVKGGSRAKQLWGGQGALFTSQHLNIFIYSWIIQYAT